MDDLDKGDAMTTTVPDADLGDLEPTFELFVQQLRARLEKGAREYGDSSFDRPTAELFDEIEEELVDIAGWTVVLLHRLQRIRASAECIGQPTSPTPK